MRITAKVAKEMAEATSRVEKSLDNIDYKIELYSSLGKRDCIHIFDGDVDGKEVRDAVINGLKERGFHVRYDKLQYVFGVKEIIIEW